MNTAEMNGKEISLVWWPDTETEQGRMMESGGAGTLYMSATHHGDHDEFWIVEAKDGKEISRFNVRFVEGWTWA